MYAVLNQSSVFIWFYLLIIIATVLRSNYLLAHLRIFESSNPQISLLGRTKTSYFDNLTEQKQEK